MLPKRDPIPQQRLQSEKITEQKPVKKFKVNLEDYLSEGTGNNGSGEKKV